LEKAVILGKRSEMKYTLLFFSFLWGSVAAGQQADDVLGTWLTQDKDSHIEIFKKGDRYFGKIVWLKEPREEDGTNKVDSENPDKSMRNRPILGLEIMRNFEFDGKDEWEDGKIYDPTDGKTYSCEMELDEGELEVTGYIGFSWIGRTVRWIRVK